MELTNETYFSPEMELEYMSTSQFKAFQKCEAMALAKVIGKYKEEEKEAFKEGKYFEACICGDEDLFQAKNPEMYSSKGKTKGDLKANYKKVVGALEAFRRQPLFMEIVDKCEKQVIVTGVIGGVKFKGCIDFLDPETLDGYDSKYVADFKKTYSELDKRYMDWYYAYQYQTQMALYMELVKQSYGRTGSHRLMSVTKESVPDVVLIEFSENILVDEIETVELLAPRYDAIKKGEREPEYCGHCNYCKSVKIISVPTFVFEVR